MSPPDLAQRFERKGPLSTQLPQAAPSPRPDIVSDALHDADETLRLVLGCLEDAKAEDIMTIDLRGRTAIADFMVVASGRSNRHVGAVADHLLKDLDEAGVRNVRVEGMPHNDWVLIDAGDMIVHVFRPEVRAFYNIEKMWGPAVAETRQAS